MTLKNTENSAIISIRNLQTIDGTETETELITEGKFYKSQGKLYVFYNEDETEETPACTVMLIISEDKVTLSRKGDFSSKMYYEKGESSQVIYHTPYGELTFLLKTLDIKNNLSDNGGSLRLLYKLLVNGEEFHNDLTITVKPERNDNL